MATHLSSRSAKVWFLYLKCLRGDRNSLSLNITREVCSYFTDPLLIPYPGFMKSQLCVVSPTDMRRRICTEVRIMGACLCLIDSAEIFYLEQGVPRKAKANLPYRMLLQTFQRTALRPMREARYHPGVAYMNGCVYVFAGKTITCERYTLRTQRWKQIAFLPGTSTGVHSLCYAGKIYLAASNSSQLHLYDPLHDHFQTIELHQLFQSPLDICIIDSAFVKLASGDIHAKLLLGDRPSGEWLSESFLHLSADWKVLGVEPSVKTWWTVPVVWEGKVYVFADCSCTAASLGANEYMAVFDASVGQVEIKPILT